ncbi:MAG: cytochrome c [Leptospirales bacterium]
MKKIIAIIAVLGLTIGLSTIFAGEGNSKNGVKLIKAKCGYCHAFSANGKKISSATSGPDLTGIATERGEPFTRIYMVNPEQGRKDFKAIYDKEIKGKYNMKMPSVRLTPSEIDDITAALK